MGILKDRAEALRLLASKLEQIGNDLPRQAKELARLFTPANCVLKFQQRIQLEYANDSGFVESTVKDAGIRMGLEIGKKLQAQFKGLRFPDWGNPFCPLTIERGFAEYEAEVVVLSKVELEKIVERAIEAGKASAL